MPSYQGAHLTFDLPAPLTQALKELSRREGATLFMTLLAAFKVLLHRYSGQEDIAVGTPIAGRGRTEHEGLIGFFVNTLVLRSNLAGNPAFTELLARVRETALGAYTHQDLPFEKLVEELSPSRDISRNPLFQVMFVLQNAPDAELVLRGVQASRLPLAGHSAKFDLTVTMGETAAGLHVRWEYSTDLFDASTVERMAQHFKMLLEGIVADADQRIGQLLLLTKAERHSVAGGMDQTELERKASLEDSYPLSSLQQGMLFHALWEKGSGVDIAQILIDLHETLDVEKFKRAWWRIISSASGFANEFSLGGSRRATTTGARESRVALGRTGLARLHRCRAGKTVRRFFGRGPTPWVRHGTRAAVPAYLVALWRGRQSPHLDLSPYPARWPVPSFGATRSICVLRGLSAGRGHNLATAATIPRLYRLATTTRFSRG